MPEGSTALIKSLSGGLLRWQNLEDGPELPAEGRLEVVFRLGTTTGAAASAPQTAVAVPLPVCVPVEPPDQKVEDAFGRVSRLLDRDGNTIGTCLRVNGDVILVARHCVLSGGRCLSNLEAFQGQLEFVAARPDLDVVAFRGPAGSSFTLLGTELQRGMLVSLLSFPLELPGTSAPALDSGAVAQVSRTGRHALATFGTGMPNSSGGAVVSSTRTLVGLYTGIVWHLEELTNSSRRSSSSSGGGSVRPPAQLERDPTAMWEDRNDEADVVEAAAASDSVAAQLSRVNIQHKTNAAMFIPAAALLQFLQAAGLAAYDPLDAAGDNIARPRLRPRHR
ncbi:hypothetical protein Agub_g11137 [Astrephomene gubernaculifera]|uniref:Uncharacterized protein n=1 Tax=Astrephomene gubernaculifera TaxID=47775 RepID=A0AAD3HPN9_9CHLO|nr:hypothetical protein Agub_g11137 [Astrephomene gubernaculifera]